MDTKIRIILGFLCAWFSMTAFAEALPADSIQIAYIRSVSLQHPRVGARIFLDGDTTVNDVNYRKCYGIGYWSVYEGFEDETCLLALLREEDSKVYILSPITDFFTDNRVFYMPYGFQDRECLIYDFNLNEGDYFSINEDLLTDEYFSEQYDGVVSQISVLSTDTITIDGIVRKVQETSEFKCIEGVGCIDSNNMPYPLKKSLWMTNGDGPFYITRLYDKDNNIIYQWRDINEGGPVNGVKKVSQDSYGKILYEKGNLTVDASGDWALALYAIDGKKARRYSGENKLTIDLANLPSGIYIARLTSNGVTKTLKLKR